MMISIIDYGIGNIGSVLNMYNRLGISAKPIVSAQEVTQAEKLILPGVGSFDRAVATLQERDLFTAIQDFAVSGKPFLGICLGMQLLLNSSEEGKFKGLALIEGTSRRFRPSGELKVPHMGWNEIIIKQEHRIFTHLASDPRFYFVHSYKVECANPFHSLATAEYGGTFTAMVQKNNIVGAQFHPEKSHTFGMQLLRGFAEL